MCGKPQAPQSRQGSIGISWTSSGGDALTVTTQGLPSWGSSQESPKGSTAFSGLLFTYAYRFHDCGLNGSTTASPPGAGVIQRPRRQFSLRYRVWSSAPSAAGSLTWPVNL